MARMPRLALGGQPHLVLQRGSAETGFRADADRLDYLIAMRDAGRSLAVAVHAYSLLADSVLLLLTPENDADMAGFMQRLSRRYVPAYHRRHGSSGPVWSGRFQAAALDAERYLLPATLMIEQAPIRTGLVSKAIDWPWSSARHHTGREASSLIEEHAAWWRIGNTPFEREARYDAELSDPLEDARVAELTGALRGGWPLGSPGFVAMAAQKANRSVVPNRRGRPLIQKK